MAGEHDEDRESSNELDRTDEDRFLRELARENQEIEARYGGEESLGQDKPMSLWERIKHVISVLGSTGPTR